MQRYQPNYTPDLVPALNMKQIAQYYDEGKLVDERPVLVDPATKSVGKVNRIMYWRKDNAGKVAEDQCCLRFEVEVIRPARGSHHHKGDASIWSVPIDEVFRHDTLVDLLHRNKVYVAEIRASLKAAGFSELAKTVS